MQFFSCQLPQSHFFIRLCIMIMSCFRNFNFYFFGLSIIVAALHAFLNILCTTMSGNVHAERAYANNNNGKSLFIDFSSQVFFMLTHMMLMQFFFIFSVFVITVFYTFAAVSYVHDANISTCIRTYYISYYVMYHFVVSKSCVFVC